MKTSAAIALAGVAAFVMIGVQAGKPWWYGLAICLGIAAFIAVPASLGWVLLRVWNWVDHRRATKR